jgi:hypothetical protein
MQGTLLSTVRRTCAASAAAVASTPLTPSFLRISSRNFAGPPPQFGSLTPDEKESELQAFETTKEFLRVQEQALVYPGMSARTPAAFSHVDLPANPAEITTLDRAHDGEAYRTVTILQKAKVATQSATALTHAWHIEWQVRFCLCYVR